MSRRRQRAGNTLGGLLVLLLIVAGAGGFNYHRNLERERSEEKTRPFEAYTDEDLAALAEAYRGEVAQWQKRQAAVSKAHGAPSAPRGSLIGERVGDFERVQRRSAAVRGMTVEIATREHRLAEIVEEQQLRAQGATGLTLHWQRLTQL